ncbi:MAG: hypothetical protein KME54_11060 [Tolypothrix brevis GSE-NOS-MK-07-07A]|nr:hypothetical protein [Tolypothrix brevis GSE-NOS-MK-07-07A]
MTSIFAKSATVRIPVATRDGGRKHSPRHSLSFAALPSSIIVLGKMRVRIEQGKHLHFFSAIA